MQTSLRLVLLLAVTLQACVSFGQDFEQVNTTSPQTLSGPKTLTSPIITDPTLSGTVIGTYILGGTPTLTNPVLSGTVTGTYTLSGSPSLVAAVLSGTLTGTYTLGGTPTITAPIFSGTITGTYTIGGTPTINSPTIATPTITGASIFGGTIRVPNNTAYLGRNAGNSADLSIAKVNAADQIEFGTTVKNFSLDANPTTTLQAATKSYVDTADSATLASAQKNPIINGNMEIWQRGTTFLGSTGYTADRWRMSYAGTSGALTVNRSTNVPTVAQAGVLFNYSLEIDVTTADAAQDAGDLYAIEHAIEGYNWRHFAQRVFTVSFWVMSPKTGVHCVAFDGGGAFSGMYVAEYTVISANTWEYKTVTVPASPSSGSSWNYTELTGLRIVFPLIAGSNYQQTANTWIVNTGGIVKYATSAQQNLLDSTANFFRLTGVKLELGNVATPIQFVPFAEELAQCQRYYQKSFPYATAPAQNAGNAGTYLFSATKAGALVNAFTVPLSPKMRGNPSVTLYNPAVANAQIRDETAGADFSLSGGTVDSENSIRINGTGNAGTAVANFLRVHWTADAEL